MIVIIKGRDVGGGGGGFEETRWKIVEKGFED